MNLREIRAKYGISQIDTANLVGVPVRTYRRYESDDNYGSSFKRQMFINIINSKYEITEDKGLLSIDQIKKIVIDLFETEYKGQIEFCYLFGSYAKGYAAEKSDVDLYVATSLTGFEFVGLIERLRERLHKVVDLIRLNEEHANMELIKEIMKDGIKIYG